METAVKRLYEAMFLIDSAMAASDWEGVNKGIETILKKAQVELVSLRKWDERVLAYEVNGKARGTYILCYFRDNGNNVRTIEREVQLTGTIMRVLILKAEHMTQEDIEKETPATKAEHRQQIAVEIAAKAAAEQASVQAEKVEEAKKDVVEVAKDVVEVEEALLEAEKDAVEAEKDVVEVEKDVVEVEEALLEAEKDVLEAEKDVVEVEKDVVEVEKDVVEVEKDVVDVEEALLEAEKDVVEAEKDVAVEHEVEKQTEAENVDLVNEQEPEVNDTEDNGDGAKQ